MEFLVADFKTDDIGYVIRFLNETLELLDINIESKEIENEFRIHFKTYGKDEIPTAVGVDSVINTVEFMRDREMIYDLDIIKLI